MTTTRAATQSSSVVPRSYPSAPSLFSPFSITFLDRIATMDGDYAQQEQDYQGPHPHPYLHEPLLYITNLPSFVTDEMLALSFIYCGPFRPKIQRDTGQSVVSGTIEFKFFEKGEHARCGSEPR